MLPTGHRPLMPPLHVLPHTCSCGDRRLLLAHPEASPGHYVEPSRRRPPLSFSLFRHRSHLTTGEIRHAHKASIQLFMCTTLPHLHVPPRPRCLAYSRTEPSRVAFCSTTDRSSAGAALHISGSIRRLSTSTEHSSRSVASH
jgi:hypothetical protein